MPKPIFLIYGPDGEEWNPAGLFSINQLSNLRKQYPQLAQHLGSTLEIMFLQYYFLQGWKDEAFDINKYEQKTMRSETLLRKAQEFLAFHIEKANTNTHNASSTGIFTDAMCKLVQIAAQRVLYPQYEDKLSTSVEIALAKKGCEKAYEAYLIDPKNPSTCKDFNDAYDKVDQLFEKNSEIYNAIPEIEKEESARKLDSNVESRSIYGDQQEETLQSAECFIRIHGHLSSLKKASKSKDSAFKFHELLEMQIAAKIAFDDKYRDVENFKRNRPLVYDFEKTISIMAKDAEERAKEAKARSITAVSMLNTQASTKEKPLGSKLATPDSYTP